MSTKILWTYWHQGWDQAPELVKQCRNSWARLNPDYEIHALDQNTLFNYIEFPSGIDIQRKDLTIQKISVIGRLALLSKYGGVWADATVMCTRPLSEWLEDYYTSRFFAFRNPGADRLISNWFIAAEPESVLLKRLYQDFSDFFAYTYFSNQNTELGNRLLDYFTPRWCSDVENSIKWHSWFARKILRVYPYFIYHYTFNKLILSDPACAELWNQVKPFAAEPPHRLQALQTAADGIAIARQEIDSGLAPMYKLDWRVDSSNPYWSAILQHLEGQT